MHQGGRVSASVTRLRPHLLVKRLVGAGDPVLQSVAGTIGGDAESVANGLREWQELKSPNGCLAHL